MENKRLEISEETLKNLSMDEIVEIKLEVDEMIAELNDIIQTCNETLNS